MIHLKKIVLPVDFSSRNALAASHARQLAERFGSMVLLVHVLRPFQVAAEGVDVPTAALLDWYAEQKPVLEKQLHEFACTYLKEVSTRCFVSEGDPGTEIVRLATTEHADLILMPTHGYGSFRRFILGSVTAKVLHDSPVPVLTSAHVEVPPEPAQPVKRLLAAVDMGPNTGRIIAIAAYLAGELRAELHLVHASPDDGAGMAHYVDPAWRVDVAKNLQADLEGQLHKMGATAKVHTIPGEAEDVVHQLAADLKADMVVIGRPTDHSLFGRLRKHGYAIVRESPCPVLSV